MDHNTNTSTGWQAAHTDADLIVWLSSKDSLSPEIPIFFKEILAESFLMGSRGYYDIEEPIHRVRISRPFYLGMFPVTQEQFEVWTAQAGIEHENHFSGNPYYPAENLYWHQATAYCDWLTSQYGRYFPSGFAAGLPTEAQWEYACRAGTETEYHTGDGAAALAATGWYEGNSKGSTQRVGQKAKNPWGLYDMHGNVWEWCQDAWDADAYKKRPDGVNDPLSINDDRDVSRVFRGGCWFDSPWGCRSAFRGGWRPDYRGRSQGFRVCLFPGPSSREETSAAVSESLTVDDQTRQASKSQGNDGETAEVNLSQSNLPPRSGGTTF